MKSISIIIPAYNEEIRLPTSLSRILSYLKSRNYDYEVVVVDDGSTDSTVNSVQHFVKSEGGRVRVLGGEENRGKGYATRKGVLAASKEYVLFSDADLSTPIEELEKLAVALDSGSDIAIASRALPDSDVRIHQNWLRERMGKIFNLILRVFGLTWYKDTQCGFKMFRKDVAQKLFSRSRVDGFAFDMEILFLARKFGYSVKEVAVTWINSPNSRVRLLGDPISMFLDSIRVRWMNLRGFYDDSFEARDSQF